MIFYNSLQEQSHSRACCALESLGRYGKYENKKIRWENEGANGLMTDYQYAVIKIYQAFGGGFIGWNTLNIALDRVETASNGSWMFDIER